MKNIKTFAFVLKILTKFVHLNKATCIIYVNYTKMRPGLAIENNQTSNVECE